MKKILILFISLCVLTSCTDYVKKQAEAETNCKRLTHQIDSMSKVKKTYKNSIDSLYAMHKHMLENQESRERNDRLIAERKSIERDINSKTNIRNSLANQNNTLNKQINANKFALACKNTIYIVKIKIHQTTYTLDIGEHIKNKINDVEFEMPVDKSYYDKCHVGQSITDASFKWGSLLMDDDFSVLKITIQGKRTIKR